jgi:hypothetical protein
MVLMLGNFKMPAVAMETTKNTQFNTKVNNTILRLRNFKMATIAMEIIFEFTA